MADPFGRGGSSGSSGGSHRSDPFGRSGAKKKSRGGILGVVERTGSDLYHAAVNTPAGVVALGKGLAHDPVGTVKDVAKATASDLRHPLRRPGYTLLDLWGIASLGAGTAARAGAVGAKLSEGARAGELAKAALHGVEPGPRVFSHDGVSVEGIYSRSPLTRLAQKQADLLREAKAPSRNAKRVGRELRRQERIVGGIERGPASALIAAGRKLSAEQQTALRVVAEGVPVSERLATHEADLAAASGRTARRLRRKIDLLHGATKYLDETDGEPKIGGEHAKLQTIYGKLEQVSHDREDLLAKIGDLTPQAIEERLHGPGRIFKGAKYETPTPGKLGRESAAMKRERSRLASLERRLGKEHAAEAAFMAKSGARDLGPISEADATARLAELDQQYETLVKKLVPETSPYGGKISQREQLVRNAANAKPRARKQRTVSADEFRTAEDALLKTIEKHRGNATADRAARVVAEREQLRNALNARGEASISGETPPRLPAGAARAHKSVPTGSNPHRNRIVLLGHALEAQQARVAAMDSAAAGRVKPTGLVGAEDFRGGKVHISHGPDAGVRGSLRRGPQVGANDVIGKPRPLASTRKPLTGAAIHQGSFGDKSTEIVGRSNLEAHKLGALLRIRDALEPAIKATPQSEHDILIRRNGLGANEPLPGIAKELREKLDLGAKLTADEQRQVQGAFERLRSHILPTTGGVPLSPEAEAELLRHFEEGKIGFVDRRLLGGLDKPQPRLETFIGTRGAKIFDAVNNAERGATLYLKPAYAIPNLLGNVALNILQQGFAAPYELSRSLRLARNPELAAKIDEVMGEGFSQSLAGEHGVGTKALQAAAHFWGRGVDSPFRRASFLYEARRAGYKTPAELERLLADEAHRPQLLQVARRANQSIIDYANLNPIERAVVARTIYFYAWTKGSSVYAAHFVADHPVEAMIAAQIGRMGKQQSDKTLGALPSYLEGLIPVGKAKNGNPIVVNPSAAAIFQTPAQVGRGIAGLASGDPSSVAELSSFTTPAVNALVELISGHQLGSPVPVHGVKNVAYDSLVANLPQTALVRNLLQALHGEGKGRLYPPTVQSALLQYLAGGIANPRELNIGVAHKQAKQGR